MRASNILIASVIVAGVVGGCARSQSDRPTPVQNQSANTMEEPGTLRGGGGTMTPGGGQRTGGEGTGATGSGGGTPTGGTRGGGTGQSGSNPGVTGGGAR